MNISMKSRSSCTGSFRQLATSQNWRCSANSHQLPKPLLRPQRDKSAPLSTSTPPVLRIVMHSRSILAATGRSCALTRTAKTVLLSFSKNKFLEGTNTPTPVLKNQSVVQLPASTFLEAAAACPNAPGVCQKSRSDGTY